MSHVRAHAWPSRFTMLLAVALLLLATAALAAKSTPAKDSPGNPAKGTPAEQSTQGTAAPAAQGADAARMKEEMEAMKKLAAPGPNHEKLKAMTGTWKATVKSYMGGPQPVVSEGTAEMEMVLGGRYLHQHFTGSFMNQPYEGMGVTGYDNQTGTYQSVWMDNISTWMMYSTGAMDEASKTMTMKCMAPGMDGKLTEMRTVMKWADPSTMVFTMYGTMGGKDQQMMEITYKKAS